MKPIIKKIINTGLVKNYITLYAKFLYDSIFNKNKLIFQGRYIKPLENEVKIGAERKKILLPTIYHLDRGLAWQVTIAKTLQVRGHDVTFMPLDIHFPKKNALYYDIFDGKYTTKHQNLYNNTLLKNFNLKNIGYSKFGDAKKFYEYRKTVSKYSFSDCLSFTYKGLPLGDMAFNSVMHYYRRGGNAFTDEEIEGYKDYLAIGMILHNTLTKALDDIKPNVIFTLNGSFIDSTLQIALAKKRRIKVVTFETGFMLNSLVLAENEPTITYPMKKYFPEGYQTYKINSDQDKILDDYLTQRSFGQNCVLDYFGKPKFNHKAIRDEIGLSKDNKPDVLFTNLQWDSTQLNCNISFKNQVEWILETINFYKKNPDLTLVIRIHPAEQIPIELESKEKISDAINETYTKLPSNVFIIPSLSKISSYPLTNLSRRILVYASTTGLEASIMNKEVIVAGRSHYRGQGFTHDIETKKQYFDLLSNPNAKIDSNTIVNNARKYAYFFFFGYMIPFTLVDEKTTKYKGELTAFNYKSESDLLANKNKDLDFIIDIILDKTTYTERLKKLII